MDRERQQQKLDERIDNRIEVRLAWLTDEFAPAVDEVTKRGTDAVQWLYGEIDDLKKQNDDQQKQIDELRGELKITRDLAKGGLGLALIRKDGKDAA